MKELGYGAGYRYDPHEEDGVAAQTYLPDEMGARTFYRPGPFGFEKAVAERLEWWSERRRARGAEDEPQGPESASPSEGA
jgi:putative ATPase